jgi:hypothetical protein
MAVGCCCKPTVLNAEIYFFLFGLDLDLGAGAVDFAHKFPRKLNTMNFIPPQSKWFLCLFSCLCIYFLLFVFAGGCCGCKALCDQHLFV